MPARSAFTESKQAKKKRFLCVFMQTDIPQGQMTHRKKKD